jgi:hypothetical protein
MKRSWLISLKEKLTKRSKEPWAAFETEGPDDEGKVGFAISWNDAFIERLRKAGYTATTDEETVQMFFLSVRMIPEALAADDEHTVNPEATPRLTSEANILRR